MRGSNLTTEEAEGLSRVLTVDTYDIALALTDAGADTFRSVTRTAVDCSEPAAPAYLHPVLSAIGAESDIGVVESLCRNDLHAPKHYTAPAARTELTARCSGAALEQLHASPPSGDHQLAWARVRHSGRHRSAPGSPDRPPRRNGTGAGPHARRRAALGDLAVAGRLDGRGRAR
jgi:hypothetical protein